MVKPGSHMPPTYLGHWDIDHRLPCEVVLSLTSQASRRSMPGTNCVSAINVRISRSYVGGHVPGRSAAYENQALPAL